MKAKTSITLPVDVLQLTDALVADRVCGNRSELIERALREFFAAREREQRDQSDLRILNTNADRLNTEAADVLTYQVEP
jgi:metal-responsive CopG/Arc/MetJ family transcriptional regulator